MVKVYSGETSLDAQLIRGLLEEHGIESVMQGEMLWAARGELPFTPETAPSVWVREQDGERARQLVIEQEQKKGVHKNPTICDQCGYDLRGSPGPRCPECGWEFEKPKCWVCPACGETLEGQFGACWKCAGDGGSVNLESVD